MQASYLSALRTALSEERLSTYRRSGQSDADVLANYLWNLALCEALYPSLQGIEVTLRNTLFDAGSRAYAGVATADVPCWLDAEPPLLTAEERARVKRAKQQLRASGKALVPGCLVSELSFGFWTALFDVRYESNGVLWPRLFQQKVFAAAPRRMRTRKALSPLINRARMLRNRVAHHEPVWHLKDLPEQHTAILDLIGWMSPDMRATLESGDRFPRVHAAGTEPFREQVDALVATPRRVRLPDVPVLALAETSLATVGEPLPS